MELNSLDDKILRQENLVAQFFDQQYRQCLLKSTSPLIFIDKILNFQKISAFVPGSGRQHYDCAITCNKDLTDY